MCMYPYVYLDGQAYTWGSNKHGKLGVGIAEEKHPYSVYPELLALPKGIKAVGICMGDFYGAFWYVDGEHGSHNNM